jgi:hypothetical protein
VNVRFVAEDHRFLMELQNWGFVSISQHILKREVVPRLESYETPLSAAKPRALAIASAMLTEPELTGLIELRSTLPELIGCGRGYGEEPTGGVEAA